MIIPVGSIINAGGIIAGGLVGLALGNRLPDRVRTIVFQGLGLCTMVLGIQMAMLTRNPLVLIFSVLIGSIVGEVIDIEGFFNKSGDYLKKKVKSENSKFTDGFVAATLLFCIGSMAILGPLEEGLTGVRTIVLTKTLLDTFASMALASVFGLGVLFSTLPLLLYQGSITVFSVSLQSVLTENLRMELTAAGGVLIMGISINLLELTRIRLSNMLPVLPCAVLLAILAGYLATLKIF